MVKTAPIDFGTTTVDAIKALQGESVAIQLPDYDTSKVEQVSELLKALPATIKRVELVNLNKFNCKFLESFYKTLPKTIATLAIQGKGSPAEGYRNRHQQFGLSTISKLLHRLPRSIRHIDLEQFELSDGEVAYTSLSYYGLLCYSQFIESLPKTIEELTLNLNVLNERQNPSDKMRAEWQRMVEHFEFYRRECRKKLLEEMAKHSHIERFSSLDSTGIVLNKVMRTYDEASRAAYQRMLLSDTPVKLEDAQIFQQNILAASKIAGLHMMGVAAFVKGNLKALKWRGQLTKEQVYMLTHYMPSVQMKTLLQGVAPKDETNVSDKNELFNAYRKRGPYKDLLTHTLWPRMQDRSIKDPLTDDEIDHLERLNVISPPTSDRNNAPDESPSLMQRCIVM